MSLLPEIIFAITIRPNSFNIADGLQMSQDPLGNILDNNLLFDSDVEHVYF